MGCAKQGIVPVQDRDVALLLFDYVVDLEIINFHSIFYRFKLALEVVRKLRFRVVGAKRSRDMVQRLSALRSYLYVFLGVRDHAGIG